MADKRLKLGIIFNFNSSWMGGIIYILNLIRTLNFLDDREKPEIFLFYRPDLYKFVNQIKYPYFQSIQWTFPNVYSGYLKSWLFGKNVFIKDIIDNFDLDGIYPVQDYPVRANVNIKIISWYADLQHEYYPEFFNKRKIYERTQRIKFILKNTDDLVVSSQTVADDFKKFFCLRGEMRLHVFHFVSVIDDLSDLNIDELLKKYELPKKYFIVSNQFHKHKNHKVLLKALVRMAERGLSIHIAMTGRFLDASHSAYMEELHYIINEYHLQSQISLLGIIPRNEQLLLMKYSQAVLQPSLFEGWSTVIEDAKSLQVPVIASNIPVNIEQLGNCGSYFDPHDARKLADILHLFPDRNIKDVFYQPYEGRIKEAAKLFINIFRD